MPGSHGDINVVHHAFSGADSVFWLVPPDPHAESVEAAYVDFTRPACDALRTHGVKQVVGISALGRGVSANAGYVTASLAMDDLITRTGVSYRALTMPSFMDNLLNQVEAIKSQGMFFSPISADRKLPTCATRDIATIAAQLLLDHSRSGQNSVAVLGPDDLSNDDILQVQTDRIRDVRSDGARKSSNQPSWPELSHGKKQPRRGERRGHVEAMPRVGAVCV